MKTVNKIPWSHWETSYSWDQQKVLSPSPSKPWEHDLWFAFVDFETDSSEHYPQISSPMLSPLSAWGLYKLLSANTSLSDRGFTCQILLNIVHCLTKVQLQELTIESQNLENLSWPLDGPEEHSGADQELLRRRRGATGRASSFLGSGKNMPQRNATLMESFCLVQTLHDYDLSLPFVNSTNFVNITQLSWGYFVR